MKQLLCTIILLTFSLFLIAQEEIKVDSSSNVLVHLELGGFKKGKVLYKDSKTIVLKETNNQNTTIPLNLIKYVTPLLSRIEKTDGDYLIAAILEENEREIYIIKLDGRKFYIPQHHIEKIEPVENSEFSSSGSYLGEEQFSTRYFFSTNGLPIKKGENYAIISLSVLDVQFNLDHNLSIGFMTSLVLSPVVGTIKKSWALSEKTHFAVGGLVGGGGMLLSDRRGALPFASLSFGDRTTNMAISAGYGSMWHNGDKSNRALLSIGAMAKINPKLSFIFDSFLISKDLSGNSETYFNPNPSNTVVLIPGLRFNTGRKNAFQLNLITLFEGRGFLPLPSVGWMKGF